MNDQHDTRPVVPAGVERTLPVSLSVTQAPVLLPAVLQAATAADPGGVPGIDFAGMWRAVRRWWWVPPVSAALAAAAAWLYIRRTPALFTARAEVTVEQETARLIGTGTEGERDLKALEMLKSIEREIVSRSVLKRVADLHGLRSDPILTTDGIPLPDDLVVERLTKRIRAGLERGTRNIVIAVDDTDPARATAICNTILKEARSRSSETTREGDSLAAEKLREQVEAARQRMETAQAAVNTFRATHPNISLEDAASDLKSNPVQDTLKSLSAAHAESRQEIVKLEQTVAQLDAAGGDTRALMKAAGIAARDEVVYATAVLAQRQAAFAAMDESYRHPKHIAAVKELQQLESNLKQVVTTAADGIRKNLENERSKLAQFSEEVSTARAGQNGYEVVFGEFQKLSREVKANRDHYSNVLAKLNEAEANRTFGGNTLRIIDAPIQPTYPVWPRPKLILAAAIAGGGMIGLGVIALLPLLAQRLRSVRAAERILKMPCLAALPLDRVRVAGDMVASGRDGGEPAAEAFRTLRTTLSLTPHGHAAQSVLMASEGEGDGKSYCALNFAVSLAQQGFRTLLIDANLRRPVLDAVLHGHREPAGLAEHLLGLSGPESKGCKPTAIANLFLFAAGTAQTHPSEVLHEQAFAKLLNDALRWFHRVVIDTAAAGPWADVLPLARHADAVCLVVRAGVTSRHAARKLAARLSMASARCAGFILNAASKEALREDFAADFTGGFTPAPVLPALPPARA